MYSYQVVRARLALAIIIVSFPALALSQTPASTEVVKNLSLTVLPERLAICRLPPDAAIPECPPQTRFWSVTRTAEELSIILLFKIPWRTLSANGTVFKGKVNCIGSTPPS